MKYIVVDREDGIWPFANEYEAENEKEALQMFITESEEMVSSLKNVKLTFELDGDVVREFADGKFDGVEFIAKEMIKCSKKFGTMRTIFTQITIMD